MQLLGAVLLGSVLTCAANPTLPGQAPAEASCEQSSEGPGQELILPTLPVACPDLEGTARQGPHWSEVWGTLSARGFVDGERMGPNGHPYDPLFALDLDLNVGLLPDQRLYLFSTSSFWAEKTSLQPGQGILDFSKREWDIFAGLAWHVAGPLELRAFGYGLNNLNRGASVTAPTGYADGAGVEGRCYLPSEDPYDVARRPFLALGYLPTKVLIDGNGNEFTPGLFARAYLIHDLPAIRSYGYLDIEGYTDDKLSPRMFFFDGGLAARPFLALPALELRVGASDTLDVRVLPQNRVLTYGAIRIIF